MKNILYIILLTTNLIFAQSGKIIYSTQIESEVFTENEKFVVELTRTREYASKQKFELKFCKNRSSFIIVKKLNDDFNFDEFENQTARLTLTTGNDIFYDNELKIEIQKNNSGQLLKKENAIYNWQITTESKKINNYLCYKAFLEEPYVNRKGEMKINTTIAWFAPSLPFSFGPKNYYGLPGLIIELIDNKTTYFISSILFFEKEEIITFPKGKTITKQDYDKRLKSQIGI